MYLKTNLKYLFKTNNYTQQYIGDIVGVENTTVSAWLSGRASPRIEILLRLREEFKISLEDLFFKDLTLTEYDYIEPATLELNEPKTEYKQEKRVNTEGGTKYEVVRIYEGGTGIIEIMQNDIEQLKNEIEKLKKQIKT